MAGRIHVVPYGGGWAIKREGADRASKITDTKSEAVEIAKNMAYTSEEVIIHNKQGQIVSRHWGYKHRQNRNSSDSDGGCFITTACVNYHELSDDCYQLATLRRFRDEFMLKTKRDKNLVTKYYQIAPKLVNLINNHPEKKIIYNQLFSKINAACINIEKGKFSEAREIYIEAVSNLCNSFQIR